MKWHSTSSNRFTPVTAAQDCLRDFDRRLQRNPEALFLFISGHSLFGQQAIQAEIRRHYPDSRLIGCSAGGVIGGGQVILDQPGIVLSALQCPEAKLCSLQLIQEQLPGLDGSPKPWKQLIPCEDRDRGTFLLFTNPFTLRTEELLRGLNYAYPANPCFGGMASAAAGLGQINLFLDDEIHSEGAVGLLLKGDLHVESLVCQGFRAVGNIGTISKCRGASIQEIDGMPALDFLSDLYYSLTEEDRKRSDFSVMAGLMINELEESPSEAGYLIRNIIDIDPGTGALALTGKSYAGQRIRFQLRDNAQLNQRIDHEKNKIESWLDNSSGGLWVHSLGFSKNTLASPLAEPSAWEKLATGSSIAGFFGCGEISTLNGISYAHELTSSLSCFLPS